ncbi:bifunctional chorismate mutase/prephenate dehydratase [Helicobacter himalayensis]|uniref:bifunctional chorismate mutase/prephenate dehydratase n=1 Tax=Helicobacter himalayensis TaxID=1591088 RepID=UPI00082F143D|nr:bifunctional chorismate mutase/prephenate dehydratase [Helicobacter himalayensis]
MADSNFLDSKRAQIDRIDENILQLLEERMGLVREIGKYKQQTKSAIYRPEREKAIIERLSSLQTEKSYLKKSAIAAIYEEIFALSRNLELPEKVGFLGPIGSYTHQAAEERFGAMSEYIALSNISSVFKALEQGSVKYGVVPIENNTNGIVGATIDHLNNSELKIIAEIILPIHHSFATNCEHITQIRRIYSKDIAFGQCDWFLKAHSLDDLELVPVDSTAKAAQLAMSEKNSAAICSKIAAKLNNLPIMFENIEDSATNKTRFVIISDFTNAPSGADKTSVFATLSDYKEGGALFSLLKDFKEFGINLTKIDSRPIKARQDFSFGFFIDFKGHYEDSNIKALFAKRGKDLKWLGSYVAGFDFEG